MKKFIRKMCYVSMACVLLASMFPSFYSKAENSDDYLEELSNEYNLQDISPDELPDGVVPIELTIDELGSFLESVTNDSESINVSSNNGRLRTANSVYHPAYVLSSAGHTTTMYANVNTDHLNNISIVHGMGVSMTGVTLGIDISNIVTSYTRSTNFQSATLYYRFDKNYYLIIEGGIKLQTIGYSAQFTINSNGVMSNASHSTY